MRTIDPTGKFKRDYKREAKGRYRKALKNDFESIVRALANDQPLAENHCDHPLLGEWEDCRECHIKPDLLLIYRKPDPDTLQLIRLGSHSELFKRRRQR